MDLVRTISSTSFTWPTIFEKRHHSPPYSIFCTSSQGLHPNVTFPQDSQMGLLLSQNFERSYLSQIKFVLRMRGKYLITFEIIFPMVYNTFQLDFIFQWCIARSNRTSFDPCFQGISGGESNSQFDSHPFFITHVNHV